MYYKYIPASTKLPSAQNVPDAKVGIAGGRGVGDLKVRHTPVTTSLNR